jgi:hypothetical protein
MRCSTIAWMLGLAACVPLAAHAQVYRCTSSNGSVAYQDRPCAGGQAQQVMDVASHPPPGYVPPPVATALPPPVADDRPPPAYLPPPPAPLPVMYACVGAVNGKHYLARRPPPPYLAPLGVMGYPPQSLARAYGPRGGAGPSAPELAKPRIGGPSVASAMTEVEDACRPAPKAEVCAYVRRQYDENDHALRLAMRSEQPALERRERELSDQLRHCR